MFFGVCSSIVCVLCTMAICILLFSYTILDKNFGVLITQLVGKSDSLLIQRTEMASRQLATANRINFQTVTRLALIIGEALDNAILETNYPIDLTKAQPVTFEEVQQGTESMVYNWVSGEHDSADAWEFAKKMTTIQDYMQEVLSQ